jgi:hypothetical protein
MKSHISLRSVLAAIMLFAVGVAMHEAARADSLVSAGAGLVAMTWEALSPGICRQPENPWK